MKRIVLEKITKLSYRIIEQTGIEDNFDLDYPSFMSSNGLELTSASVPEVSLPATVFVRGDYVSGDLNPLIFDNIEDTNKFLFAVDEYNITYEGNVPSYLKPPDHCICKSAIMCKVCMSNPTEALNF